MKKFLSIKKLLWVRAFCVNGKCPVDFRNRKRIHYGVLTDYFTFDEKTGNLTLHLNLYYKSKTLVSGALIVTVALIGRASDCLTIYSASMIIRFFLLFC